MDSVIKLRPIQPGEDKQAVRVMAAVIREIWHVSFARVRAEVDEFADLDDIQTAYFKNGGTFLVLEDEGKIIGIGAIGRVSRYRAELKRIWMLKPYRGFGLGKKMVSSLLDFAREKGFRTVELYVFSPELQVPAVELYKKFGFQKKREEPNGEGGMSWMMVKDLRDKKYDQP